MGTSNQPAILIGCEGKGGATNLKMGGQCIGRWEGGQYGKKTLTFEKDGGGGNDPSRSYGGTAPV